MMIKCWNGRSDIISFCNSSRHNFNSRKCSFHSRFDLSGLAQSTPQHDKGIMVIRLRSSGTRMLILRKALAFIGKTLKKYIKNSLTYRTFIKTHFNSVLIQIKRLISDVCACVVLCTLTHRFLYSDNVNFQNLKDVIATAQLKTNGTSF